MVSLLWRTIWPEPVPDIPLRERATATIGDASAISHHSAAWLHQEVRIALEREAAERTGAPIDESRGKGIRSVKAGGRRLILVDSLLERMGLTRSDLPNVEPRPALKLAPRGLPVAKARATTTEADPLPPFPGPRPQPRPTAASSTTARRPPGRPRGGPDDLPPAA